MFCALWLIGRNGLRHFHCTIWSSSSSLSLYGLFKLKTVRATQFFFFLSFAYSDKILWKTGFWGLWTPSFIICSPDGGRLTNCAHFHFTCSSSITLFYHLLVSVMRPYSKSLMKPLPKFVHNKQRNPFLNVSVKKHNFLWMTCDFIVTW